MFHKASMYSVDDGQGKFTETVQDCFRPEYRVIVQAWNVSDNGLTSLITAWRMHFHE